MTTKRAVTERDFWQPRFVGQKPDDYEFRDDGEIVRKDRWEMAIRRIGSRLGCLESREFEISDIEAAIEKLIEEKSWSPT